MKHLAKLREAEEVEEDLDARVFGNLLHEVVFWFYKELAEINNGVIERGLFKGWEERVEKLIDKAFIHFYKLDPEKKVVYEGQRVVVRTIVKEFMAKIVQHDKAHTPFTIEALEEAFSFPVTINDHQVLIGGKIDRVDRKADVVRIIDYKTGKDELAIENIESLFDGTGKRNKAAFQTMLYAYLYHKQVNANVQLVPGLMNRKNLFDSNYTFGHPLGKGHGKKPIIQDARIHFESFERLLHDLLLDLYDPESLFDQTTNLKSCQWCPYKGICRR